jgi:hypothetical protein
MKERQSLRKRLFWNERRVGLEQKLAEEAEMYERQIENYYRKIEVLKDSEEQLRQQELQAQ